GQARVRRRRRPIRTDASHPAMAERRAAARRRLRRARLPDQGPRAQEARGDRAGDQPRPPRAGVPVLPLRRRAAERVREPAGRPGPAGARHQGGDRAHPRRAGGRQRDRRPAHGAEGRVQAPPGPAPPGQHGQRARHLPPRHRVADGDRGEGPRGPQKAAGRALQGAACAAGAGAGVRHDPEGRRGAGPAQRRDREAACGGGAAPRRPPRRSRRRVEGPPAAGARGRLRQLEAAEDALMQQFRLATELETKIKMIDDLAQRGTCPVCQQAAPNRDAERAELAGKLQQTHFDRDKLAEVSASIRKLRRVQGAGAAQTIRLIEERLAQILVDTTHAELERDKVHDRVKNHNTAAAARAYQEWEQATKETGLLQQCLKDRTDSIRKLEAQAEDYRRKIAGLSGIAAASLKRDVEIYQQLIELFRHGVDELRNQLRKAVERDASEIFRQLTTDKSYQGLRINESYGLTIVDAQGSDVQVRSAGAEQVVALSLIGALNRNAVRRGPVVMDTPFGRLDPKHRENILRFVPRMADQAVLLVHGGEVDRTRDLACIRDDINREYEIERISSRRSRFATTVGEEPWPTRST